MNDIQKYIFTLLGNQGIHSPQQFEKEFLEFAAREENIKNVSLIRQLQIQMTQAWEIRARRLEIAGQYITFPNGMAGKPYTAVFDFEALNLTDLTFHTLTGFESTGLEYDAASGTISGTPEQAGDITLEFAYNFEGEDEGAEPNVKKLSIIVNADPKSLWKDIPSDANGLYAKPDNVAETVQLGGKTLVVASRRGRSHANTGGYRDDDYDYAELENGWSVIAVSDGAGSALAGRKGSEIACNAVVYYLKHRFTATQSAAIDEAVSANAKEKIKELALPYLLGAANHAFEEIENFSREAEMPLNSFHATLVFALVKHYPQGSVFMTFSIGDCPMALVNKDMTGVTLMNKLDVGEFGGGTRFVTMPEIFRADDFEERFTFEMVTDFSYFVLMTDGIYDPKFEVEANLDKIERWQRFFEDLDLERKSREALPGMRRGNDDIRDRLAEWMDFWSPGNHDDRTLAILF
ncbi:protein phosphatase 2C domain-containing protein [Flavobacterium sp. MFBS3-15]|uniref:PP2C family serine/threonine-protein phosphatase n=1 Tax=Flavobacterium sp. MFBS3-15 TaxID=2989816 RepID=UPI002235562D|nr:PP2C family serine/threonine-protein phosphatase [Flavobacterium sp. MFBS3-15]MCW4467750.1 protein phosphatase 2C domain-containing protein [Flavobacterium sp. MFBS3-15]